jgi:hypothetical protein
MNRLAHEELRHAEAFAQLALGRQLGIGDEGTQENVLREGIEDAIGQVRPRERVRS